MNRTLQLGCLLLGLLLSVRGWGAETKVLYCVVCSQQIKPGPYWNYILPTTKKEVFICPECKELKQNCSLCGLPVKPEAEKSGDGRYYCAQDYPNAAVKDEDIRQIFVSVTADLLQMTGGRMTLRHPAVTLSIYDIDYWNIKDGQRNAVANQRHGMATSRPVGGGFAHSILLYRGLWKDEMAAVCAHEYTHLWINENKPKDRTIEPQTIEAVCEVVALALMEQSRRDGQIKNIMENGYTEGRITTAAKFYKVHGLGRILDWVKDGREPVLDEVDFKLTYQDAPVQPMWTAGPKASRTTYDRLQLKGVIVTKEKTLALINGKTFMKDETVELEVAGKKRSVKVLEILADSVKVQLDGQPEPVKLLRE